MTEHRHLTERLERERPAPRPTFVGELLRHLSDAPVAWRELPGSLRLRLAAYSGCGLLLLLAAALGVAGIGPFAA
jgi:hypothetical protein